MVSTGSGKTAQRPPLDPPPDTRERMVRLRDGRSLVSVSMGKTRQIGSGPRRTPTILLNAGSLSMARDLQCELAKHTRVIAYAHAEQSPAPDRSLHALLSRVLGLAQPRNALSAAQRAAAMEAELPEVAANLARDLGLPGGRKELLGMKNLDQYLQLVTSDVMGEAGVTRDLLADPAVLHSFSLLRGQGPIPPLEADLRRVQGLPPFPPPKHGASADSAGASTSTPSSGQSADDPGHAQVLRKASQEGGSGEVSARAIATAVSLYSVHCQLAAIHRHLQQPGVQRALAAAMPGLVGSHPTHGLEPQADPLVARDDLRHALRGAVAGRLATAFTSGALDGVTWGREKGTAGEVARDHGLVSLDPGLVPADTAGQGHRATMEALVQAVMQHPEKYLVPTATVPGNGQDSTSIPAAEKHDIAAHIRPVLSWGLFPAALQPWATAAHLAVSAPPAMSHLLSVVENLPQVPVGYDPTPIGSVPIHSPAKVRAVKRSMEGSGPAGGGGAKANAVWHQPPTIGGEFAAEAVEALLEGAAAEQLRRASQDLASRIPKLLPATLPPALRGPISDALDSGEAGPEVISQVALVLHSAMASGDSELAEAAEIALSRVDAAWKGCLQRQQQAHPELHGLLAGEDLDGAVFDAASIRIPSVASAVAGMAQGPGFLTNASALGGWDTPPPYIGPPPTSDAHADEMADVLNAWGDVGAEPGDSGLLLLATHFNWLATLKFAARNVRGTALDPATTRVDGKSSPVRGVVLLDPMLPRATSGGADRVFKVGASEVRFSTPLQGIHLPLAYADTSAMARHFSWLLPGPEKRFSGVDDPEADRRARGAATFPVVTAPLATPLKRWTAGEGLTADFLMEEYLFRDALFRGHPEARLRLGMLQPYPTTLTATGLPQVTRDTWRRLAERDPSVEGLHQQMACLGMEDYLLKAAMFQGAPLDAVYEGGLPGAPTEEGAAPAPGAFRPIPGLHGHTDLGQRHPPLKWFADRWSRGQLQSTWADWCSTAEHRGGLQALLQGAFAPDSLPFPVQVLVTSQENPADREASWALWRTLHMPFTTTGASLFTHYPPSADVLRYRQAVATWQESQVAWWAQVFGDGVFRVKADPAVTREVWEPSTAEVAAFVRKALQR